MGLLLGGVILGRSLEAGTVGMGENSIQPGTPDGDPVDVLLSAVTSGQPGSEAQLLALAYDELRAIAGTLFRHERADHTLQPTALVHDAFLKLVRGRDTGWQSRAHFVAVAAKAMRQVLIDHARAKRSQKRSGKQKITLSGILLDDTPAQHDLLDINATLERLAEIEPRQARVVEMRFFAGMTSREVALVLGVSERTVELDWRMARAWLRRELEQGAP